MTADNELTARESTRLHHPEFWEREDKWVADGQRAAEVRRQHHLATIDDDLDAIWDRHNPPVIDQWQPPRWGAFYWLRRMIIRAAPTCTLWVRDIERDVFRSRFNKRWVVTSQDIASHG